MELTTQDLKSVILALLTMALVYGFKRFWQYRTKKAIAGKIEGLKVEQEWLERVGNSFEEAVLFSFRLLFIVLFLIGVASIVGPLLDFISGAANPFTLFKFASWVLVIVASFVSVSKLSQIRRYPEETERLKQKIKALEVRLSKFEDQ